MDVQGVIDSWRSEMTEIERIESAAVLIRAARSSGRKLWGTLIFVGLMGLLILGVSIEDPIIAPIDPVFTEMGLAILTGVIVGGAIAAAQNTFERRRRYLDTARLLLIESGLPRLAHYVGLQPDNVQLPRRLDNLLIAYAQELRDSK